MPLFKPETVPGYLEAIEQENLLRDAAFLPVRENIAGFEVCQMTLRHWLILRVAKSPMIYGGVPTPEQMAQFLWVMHPAYNPEGRGKWRFRRMCKKAFRNPVWTQNLIAGARKYMAETMQDREAATNQGEGFEPTFYSDVAYLVGLMALHLGFSREQTLETPLAQIFQFKKVIRDLLGSTVPSGNPSERLISDHLEKLNQERRRN
jgi:hypothetical protein